MAQTRRHSYVLGNDAVEQARLDKQHEALLELQHGTLLYSPFRAEGDARILDIGCGTGAFTMELARRFPSAKLIGVDISDVQWHEKPSNVEYVHGDFNALLGGSSLPLGTFDFTFHRALVLGLRNWRDFVGSVFSLLKPGGYSEMHEFDFRFRRGGRIVDNEFDHKRALNEIMGADGYDMAAGLNIESHMRAAGFEDVQVCGRYLVPYGTWMVKTNPETAKIGELFSGQNINALKEMISRVLLPAGYPREEVDRLRQEMDILKQSEGLAVEMIVTIGKKPA